MVRYVVLLNFTESGATTAKTSTERAAAFRAAAGKAGAEVESVYWTLGSYDGVFVLRAPDEATAASLVLDLAGKHTVRTCMLRAFDASEFKAIAAKLS